MTNKLLIRLLLFGAFPAGLCFAVWCVVNPATHNTVVLVNVNGKHFKQPFSIQQWEGSELIWTCEVSFQDSLPAIEQGCSVVAIDRAFLGDTIVIEESDGDVVFKGDAMAPGRIGHTAVIPLGTGSDAVYFNTIPFDLQTEDVPGTSQEGASSNHPEVAD